MKFYNCCKAAAWAVVMFAALAVGVLASMAGWKLAKWWNAF